MSSDSLGVAGVETAPAFAPHHRPTLSELARVFVYIGLAGFGGGMAIVALIEDICVRRRRWMSSEEFAHGVAFGQFLGAFAVNTTTFIGFRMLGLVGAITAVTAFLAPGVALVIVLSALYVRYSSVPAMQSALHGIGPIVVAILISAAYRMGRAALETARRSDGGSSEPQEVSHGRVPRAQAVRTALEPAMVCLGAFALMFFLHVPVILILAAVAAYGTTRQLIGRSRTPKGSAHP